MFGDKRVEKQKTPVYKCNLNPIFNHDVTVNRNSLSKVQLNSILFHEKIINKGW